MGTAGNSCAVERRIVRVRLRTPYALPRAIMVISRRQCVIVTCEYDAAEGIAVFGVSGRRSQTDRLPEWLGNLIDVTAVSTVDRPSESTYERHSRAAS